MFQLQIVLRDSGGSTWATFGQATKALLEELVGFSPSPQGRANLQRILETTWRMIEKAQEAIAARIDSGEIERAAEQLLATSNDSSGSSPASAASSPAS